MNEFSTKYFLIMIFVNLIFLKLLFMIHVIPLSFFFKIIFFVLLYKYKLFSNSSSDNLQEKKLHIKFERLISNQYFKGTIFSIYFLKMYCTLNFESNFFFEMNFLYHFYHHYNKQQFILISIKKTSKWVFVVNLPLISI